MVKIYSTPTCYYCNIAKKYFKEKGIKFVDYNVSGDRRKAMEMVHKTGQQGVPVIDINGKIIVGFDKKKIDQMFTN
jgi:glutaredoxin 3